jgi:hypothetical protein
VTEYTQIAWLASGTEAKMVEAAPDLTDMRINLLNAYWQRG